MKLNIDADPKDMGIALSAFFASNIQNPNIKVKESIQTSLGGVNFTITKNEDSFTIKGNYR